MSVTTWYPVSTLRVLTYQFASGVPHALSSLGLRRGASLFVEFIKTKAFTKVIFHNYSGYQADIILLLVKILRITCNRF